MSQRRTLCCCCCCSGLWRHVLVQLTQPPALVNTVIDILFRKRRGTFDQMSDCYELLRRRTLFHEVRLVAVAWHHLHSSVKTNSIPQMHGIMASAVEGKLLELPQSSSWRMWVIRNRKRKRTCLRTMPTSTSDSAHSCCGWRTLLLDNCESVA